MTRILAAFALAVVAAPVPGGAQDSARVLQIDAVAIDRNGMPVQDLKAEDLEVWIAGYRVPIETLVAVRAGEDDRSGRSIVLLLDDMTLPPAMVPRARQAARRFVNRLAPGDQMAIVTLGGEGMKVTADRAPLIREINRYNVRASGFMRPDDMGALVFRTIASISRQIVEAPGRRKTIVAIGPAWLFDTPMPSPGVGRDLHPEWQDAMRALAFAHANLYVIDPGGVGASRTTGGAAGFARDAGGHAFMNTNDLNAAADRILREAGTYYLISATDPPAHRKAPLRELEIRALRRGVTIHARRGIPGTQ